jgi:anti-anti-sigma regulatory factor
MVTVEFGKNCKAEDIESYSELLSSSSEKEVEIDMTNTDYIDSSIVGLCLSFKKESEKRGKKVRFKISPSVKRILDMIGAYPFFRNVTFKSLREVWDKEYANYPVDDETLRHNLELLLEKYPNQVVTPYWCAAYLYSVLFLKLFKL